MGPKKKEALTVPDASDAESGDVSDVEMDSTPEQPKEDDTLGNCEVVTKYQAAAKIANDALKKVVDASIEGSKIIDLCMLGDKYIEDAVKTVYNKGKIPKGIGFPTSVSKNHYICHYSPLPSDPDAYSTLTKGEMVRIELGVHVDGFLAQVATTLVVGADKENPISGRQADALMAAYVASETAIRTLKPGRTNVEVTEIVQKSAEEFGCKPIEGMLSHQITRNNMEGQKQIILNPTDQQKKDSEKQTFAEGEVYAVDILVSTGEGKPKTADSRTTIYRRNPDQTYLLKMQTSRRVLSEVKSRFGSFAFNLRHMEEEKKARMGILECEKHAVVSPYPVLCEKEGEHIAHFQFTVLLLPAGPLKITSFPWDASLLKSEKEVKSEELKELLKTSVRKSNKKKKKSKSAGGADKKESEGDEV
ncbi:hypothetical protein SeMB42_g03988 [Synchytrium endobioticum]|uniref:Peptidase M24 domain-containing protein n=1 Tax=Synchytrium endobioticum TaxID=286115 RepID=A0A507CYU3_9FUNG|nr:hypothetical protein SeLEV6574_g04560 [Synchytrium endobioticum]TPX45480.1 hypothetical protein SeMB42_g03988 [Synchytrium endobioticum]